MINLYLTDCTPLLNRDKLETILPQLDTARQARVRRLQHAEKAAQCAAAGWLLTYLFGQDGRPPRLTHGSRGKPYLMDDRRYFSLAHTGQWVACAVADNEVGLDAEGYTPYRPAVAERCFTEDEKRWLQQDPEGRFTRLWVAKEAYLKFTGFGLVLPMSSFTVPLPPHGQKGSCHWHELTHKTQDGTVNLCLCTDNDEAVSALSYVPL